MYLGTCRYAPGMKKWMDNQIMEAWIKALQDRCHMHPSLADKQEAILPALRREVQALTERHAGRRTDSRSETHIQVSLRPEGWARVATDLCHVSIAAPKRCLAHLQVASLVLATHKVLLPYVRNEGEVIDMLREQNGSKSEEGIRCAHSARNSDASALSGLPMLVSSALTAFFVLDVASDVLTRVPLLREALLRCTEFSNPVCAAPHRAARSQVAIKVWLPVQAAPAAADSPCTSGATLSHQHQSLKMGTEVEHALRLTLGK